MREPVSLIDGTCMEKDPAVNWLITLNHNTSPFNGTILKSKDIIPNKLVQEFIDQYLEENPQLLYSPEDLVHIP